MPVPLDGAVDEYQRAARMQYALRASLRLVPKGRRRRAWGFAAGLLVASAAAAASFAWVAQPSHTVLEPSFHEAHNLTASTVRTIGEGVLLGKRAGEISGEKGALLSAGSGVWARLGPVELKSESTIAQLEPGASLMARELLDVRETYSLETGTIAFSVDPNRKKLVQIETPNGRVEVVGTKFIVTVREPKERSFDDGKDQRYSASPLSVTTVSVSEGRVRVHHAGEIHVVSPGEQWSSENSRLAGDTPSLAPFHPTPIPRRTESTASLSKKGGSVAATTTLAEENRLFQAALIARNSGRDVDCARLLDEFTRRYPSSMLRREAELEQARVNARLNTKERTRIHSTGR